jgi:SAM-dependent methyltransferase
MADFSFEAGSFRDRTNRVFYNAGTVFRSLNQRALEEWKVLSSTAFFRRFSANGKLVPTERVDAAVMPVSERHWAAVLKHKAIPFISYPYEWPFGMLQDAALLHLELLLAAIDEQMILKDASPFNVQWEGTNPLFIDIPSFERLSPGEPWVGYRQFCQLFLYPLLLQTYKDIPFQPWLRGNLDGIEAEHCKNLMSVRDLLRPGVFLHVYLQAKAEARYAQPERDIKHELRGAGFNPTLIKANGQRLRKIIEKLAWRHSKSAWSNYVENNTYTDEDTDKKRDFVRQVVRSRTWNLVWDLGCNVGTFSRIAAENARYVVAMDADQLVIERFYQALKAEGQTTILPLVNNIADPSPNLGWCGRERKALPERGKPDLTLCLALIHHIVLGANIPLKEFIDWLAALETTLVIEFVTREDPMVQALLRHKRDDYVDYERASFERCLAEAFDVLKCEVLSSGTRILYHGQAKLHSGQ